MSFSVDVAHEHIVYTSTRTIQPDEELCIFYGHKLWFDSVDGPRCRTSDLDENTDPWGGLADIQGHTVDNVASTSSDASRDIVAQNDLPFSWKKLGLEKEEEKLDDIELGNHRSSIRRRLFLMTYSPGMGRRHTRPNAHCHYVKVRPPRLLFSLSIALIYHSQMAETIWTRQGRTVPSQTRSETSLLLHAPPRHIPRTPHASS